MRVYFFSMCEGFLYIRPRRRCCRCNNITRFAPKKALSKTSRFHNIKGWPLTVLQEIAWFIGSFSRNNEINQNRKCAGYRTSNHHTNLAWSVGVDAKSSCCIEISNELITLARPMHTHNGQQMADAVAYNWINFICEYNSWGSLRVVGLSRTSLTGCIRLSLACFRSTPLSPIGARGAYFDLPREKSDFAHASPKWLFLIVIE